MSMATSTSYLLLCESIPWISTTGITIFLVVLISRLIYAAIHWHSRPSTACINAKEEKKTERKMDFFECVLDELHALGGANICCGLNLKSKSSLPYNEVYNALNCVSRKYPLLRTVIAQQLGDDNEVVKYLRVINDRHMVSLNQFNVEDWVSVWEKEVEMQFDCEKGPLWQTCLLKERYDTTLEEYHNTVLFTFYHGTIDGMAVLKVAQEFVQCLESISKGTIPSEDDSDVTCKGLSPGLMTSLALRQFLHFRIMQWLLPQFIVFYIVKFAMRVNLLFDAKNPILAQYGNPVRPAGSKKGTIRIIPRQLSTEKTQKLIKFCRRNSCTVYGAMLACCNLAVAKLLQGGKMKETNVRFGWYCPVNVRAQCQPRIHEDDLGSYTTVLMENVNVQQINTANPSKFWNFAKRCTKVVHGGIKNGRHLFSLYLLPFTHLLNPKEFVSEFLLHSQMKDSELISPAHSLTNLGRIEWRKGEDGDIYEIEKVFGGSGAYKHGATFVNHMATFNDVFTWSTSYITTSVTEKEAERYVDLVFEFLLDALPSTHEE